MNGYAEQIKAALTAKQVAEYYGFKVNYGGYISCPFHSEKTPSLKLYDETNKGFMCFGCGKGGDVIYLAMHLFNISFKAACVRLSNDFNLNVTRERRSHRDEIKALSEVRERAKERIFFELEYILRTLEFRRLWKAYIHKTPKNIDDKIDDDYAEACRRLPILDYWFENHPYQG